MFREGFPLKITDRISERMTVSFEVFPPKEDRPVEPLFATLDKLIGLSPDFISCTYGAGGTNKGRQSEILEYISSHGTKALSNFTCIRTMKQDVDNTVGEYGAFGVDSFLALRGDYPKGEHCRSTNGDFNYGSELIEYMKNSFPELEIAGGAYPEKHLDSPDLESEAKYILIKQEAGMDFAVTQLCHDLDNYFRYYEMIRKAGFEKPVVFGLMPVLSKDATINMALVNGCSIPRQLAEIIGKYGNEPDDFKKAGKEYTVKQIERLVKEGVQGIHVFALNKYDDVAEIVKAAGIVR